jgi:mannose/fructose/N-acetylgalactosamine-specific phosphotransferase system component IIC
VATGEDLRLRLMTDIQSVIGRLSQNSFVVRGWSVTLVSIIFAIVTAQKSDNRAFALLAIPPAVILWTLDAYYLHRERLFRRMYASVARDALTGGEPDARSFEMNTDEFRGLVPSYRATLIAGHVVIIPAMLVILSAALSLISLG